LGGALKEEIEHECRVAPGQGLEFVRQGDYQVEIGDRQESLQARGQPPGLREALALGTVAVAAGVIGDGQVAATLAAGVQVSAQPGGAAVFDIPHGQVLLATEAMVFAVLRAMVAKDLGHLQGWSRHEATAVTGRVGSYPGGSPASGPAGR
jgi:hypothetical protein